MWTNDWRLHLARGWHMRVGVVSATEQWLLLCCRGPAAADCLCKTLGPFWAVMSAYVSWYRVHQKGHLAHWAPRGRHCDCAICRVTFFLCAGPHALALCTMHWHNAPCTSIAPSVSQSLRFGVSSSPSFQALAYQGWSSASQAPHLFVVQLGPQPRESSMAYTLALEASRCRLYLQYATIRENAYVFGA